MTRTISLIILGFSSLVMFTGCASMVGNMAGSSYLNSQQGRMVKFPQPSAGFQPKKTYDTNYDKSWESVMHALEGNRITTVSLDKANGRIVTDYVQGETQTQGPAGIMGAITTRYKYELTLEKNEPTKTRIGIISKLESKSVIGGDPASGWRDVSYENKQLIAMLENWLYEQIEKSSSIAKR
jgi:hypothetical protein